MEEKITPRVGMGITWNVGSDKYAGTITSVSKSGKTFKFKKDKHKLLSKGEFRGDETYTYERDDEAEERRAFYSQLGEGSWRVSKSTAFIRLGERKYLMCPEF